MQYALHPDIHASTDLPHYSFFCQKLFSKYPWGRDCGNKGRKPFIYKPANKYSVSLRFLFAFRKSGRRVFKTASNKPKKGRICKISFYV
jgi:hypothetical protein